MAKEGIAIDETTAARLIILWSALLILGGGAAWLGYWLPLGVAVGHIGTMIYVAYVEERRSRDNADN